jgi:hypothetical protein
MGERGTNNEIALIIQVSNVSRRPWQLLDTEIWKYAKMF